jgi:hypothetical protein
MKSGAKRAVEQGLTALDRNFKFDIDLGADLGSRRRRSAAAWLLGSRFRIPLRAWMFFCCVVLCR